MTEEKAQELFEEWKERLGLHDWSIEFFPFSEKDDLDDESVGTAMYQEVIKTARIYILDEKYFDYIGKFDFEKTLVHELLHLKTCLISDSEDKMAERVAHQLIEDLARALIDAKYKGVTK